VDKRGAILSHLSNDFLPGANRFDNLPFAITLDPSSFFTLHSTKRYGQYVQ